MAVAGTFTPPGPQSPKPCRRRAPARVSLPSRGPQGGWELEWGCRALPALWEGKGAARLRTRPPTLGLGQAPEHRLDERASRGPAPVGGRGEASW